MEIDAAYQTLGVGTWQGFPALVCPEEVATGGAFPDHEGLAGNANYMQMGEFINDTRRDCQCVNRKQLFFCRVLFCLVVFFLV